mgnify:CR=1 FL=1
MKNLTVITNKQFLQSIYDFQFNHNISQWAVILHTDRGKVVIDVTKGSQQIVAALPRVTDVGLKVGIWQSHHEIHCADTGVPHAVILLPDETAVKQLNIDKAALEVRAALPLNRQSCNVNFASMIPTVGYDADARVMLRTFERGVEGETLACGTGAAATAFIVHSLGLIPIKEPHQNKLKVDVVVASGAIITVYITAVSNQDSVIVEIEGPARLVFAGTFNPSSLNLHL